jgi:hypothetical protein
VRDLALVHGDALVEADPFGCLRRQRDLARRNPFSPEAAVGIRLGLCVERGSIQEDRPARLRSPIGAEELAEKDSTTGERAGSLAAIGAPAERAPPAQRTVTPAIALSNVSLPES